MIGKAIGKIILIGEHAVVYGEPAIALPFKEVGIEVFIKASQGPLILKSKLYEGRLDAVPDRLKGLQTIIYEVLNRMNQKPLNITLEIISQMPEERGLGSSAAVSVATIRALYAYYQVKYTNQDLFEMTQLAERINHGNPSGIDAAIMTDEKALYYRKYEAFLPITLNLNAFLVVADTGIKGRTKEAVEQIRNKIDGDPSCMNGIKEIGRQTETAKEAIETHDLIKLGTCMTEAHRCLQAFGVSHEVLDDLVSAAIEAGAYGAKMTGGGRGGCMIALVNEVNCDTVSEALLKSGAKETWFCYLGGPL
jgi:mevalonate kinase